MNDLISRQAAIDAVGKYLKKDGDVITIADVVDAAVAIGMLPAAEPDFSCDGCQTPKHICRICMRNYPNVTDHYCRGEWAEDEVEHTIEEFMYGQDMGSEEDGSL